MRVVHDPGSGEPRVLASDVEIADSALARARGLMFRSSIPEDYALVLEVEGGGLPFSEGPARQFVHMLCMRFPIDVVWLVGEEVRKTARLSPWLGAGLARADRILELPAGRADGVEVGDTVRLQNGE